MRLELATWIERCFTSYSVQAPRTAGSLCLHQQRCREELVLGCSFPSEGFARGHKPSLSSTDLLGRFRSKFAHLEQRPSIVYWLFARNDLGEEGKNQTHMFFRFSFYFLWEFLFVGKVFFFFGEIKILRMCFLH